MMKMAEDIATFRTKMNQLRQDLQNNNAGILNRINQLKMVMTKWLVNQLIAASTTTPTATAIAPATVSNDSKSHGLVP